MIGFKYRQRSEKEVNTVLTELKNHMIRALFVKMRLNKAVCITETHLLQATKKANGKPKEKITCCSQFENKLLTTYPQTNMLSPYSLQCKNRLGEKALSLNTGS